jgi:toxin ParE1/3/4
MRYLRELSAIVAYVSARNPTAAARLQDRIERQVENLADPNYPRRSGRLPGTRELVVHPNCIVVLRDELTQVIVMRIVHVRRAYP